MAQRNVPRAAPAAAGSDPRFDRLGSAIVRSNKPLRVSSQAVFAALAVALDLLANSELSR